LGNKKPPVIAGFFINFLAGPDGAFFSRNKKAILHNPANFFAKYAKPLSATPSSTPSEISVWHLLRYPAVPGRTPVKPAKGVSSAGKPI
jgi:hypothetical protein